MAKKEKRNKKERQNPAGNCPALLDLTINLARIIMVGAAGGTMIVSLMAGVDLPVSLFRVSLAVLISGLLLYLIAWFVVQSLMTPPPSENSNPPAELAEQPVSTIETQA